MCLQRHGLTRQNMNGLDRPILIAGAGISGLSAALCLTRAGFDVHLIERAGTFDEVGAGLQLSPNASRILIRLGLDRLLDPLVGKPQSLTVRSARSGRILVDMPFGDEAERRWGAPMWVAHRADLQAALLTLVRQEPRLRLSPGSEVGTVAETATGVTAVLRGGRDDEDLSTPLFLAADGLWSGLRRQLEGGSAPRFAGRSAYRATVAIDGVPAPLRRNATGLWLGHHAHLVHYPLRGGSLVNIVAIIADDHPEENGVADVKSGEVRQRFDDFALPARELLALPAEWKRWPLYVRPPLRRWPGKRMLVIGDAAHPMVPFLAQGASMAIEDAWVLARCLSAGADIDSALICFKRERTARVSRVQREANRNGQIFHLGGVAALARDIALTALGPKGLAARYDWLYGFRA